MRLLIDQGNTRTKWQLRSSGAIDSDGGVANTSLSELSCCMAGKSIDEVIISSVAKKSVQAQLRTVLRGLSLPFRFLQVSAGVLGVRPAYAELDNLGVDRWLAFIAAYHQVQNDVVVVDCGSAITVDFVRRSGDHLGGLILPGVELLYRSLAIKSDALSIAPGLSASVSLIGVDTASCVDAGIGALLAGLVSRVERVVCREKLSPTVVITGGDADYLAAMFDRVVQVRRELVLDGVDLVGK